MNDLTEDTKHIWKPGDWFTINYGPELRVFYILFVNNGKVYATTSRWIQSFYIVFLVEKLDKEAEYLGTGKRNWLSGWMGVFPRYHKPKGMGWL